MVRFQTEFGQITITPRAIADIARTSALKSYGVVGMASPGLLRALLGTAGLAAYASGVGVAVKDGVLTIDLYIAVEYGTNIATVVDNLAESVQYNLQKMAGVKAQELNVHVCRLKLDHGAPR